MSKQNVRDVIVANLRSLMKEMNLPKKKLAAKSGVSERMIGYILSKEKTPTVEITDMLATPFGLRGWQLQIPGIKAAIVRDGKLESLVLNYNDMSESGRKYLDRVVEQEVKYVRSQK